MKLKTLAFALSVVMPLWTGHAYADSLVSKAQQEQAVQTAHNAAREQGFNHTEASIKAQRDALLAKRDQLQNQTDKLSKSFSQNEEQLAELEEKLRLETGSLGELFGVVRQAAKDLNHELDNSVTSLGANHDDNVVTDIVAAKSLPSMAQLTGLWRTMIGQIQASDEVAKVEIPYVNGTGELNQVSGFRLGSFGLITDDGYVNWNSGRGNAEAFPIQPENGPTSASFEYLNQTGMMDIVINSSRGEMLAQLANEPTLMDCLKAGGVVGQIILVLLAIGGGIALFRGANLIKIRQQISRQLKNPEQPSNNPLGRILSVYNKEQNRSVEALELRLMETIIDEQEGLEKGLSMLKLLAALAPMLGLLGTVTG
ncbi:MotA/TolQ/ExbB proton channel family protein [Photobacterium damselae subsp. piscicida]|nr:MotA/TolQ/ExbB proton channel family protein [Photobacterium damselae subsp. piscicida]